MGNILYSDILEIVKDDKKAKKLVDYFEKRLEELSGGRIDVQVYPSKQLYNDKAVLKAIRLNSVQMACPSFSKFGKIVAQLALFDLPFLFRDVNHVHAVMDGEVGKTLKELVTKKGFVALNYWDNGFKHLSSSKKRKLDFVGNA